MVSRGFIGWWALASLFTEVGYSLNRLRQHLPSIVGLAIALGSSYIFSLVLGTLSPALEFDSRVVLQLVLKWAATLVLLLIVLRWERVPLNSIGIRKMTVRDVMWAFVGFFVGGVIIMVTMPIVSTFGFATTESGVRTMAELPIRLRIASVLTAGITEEVLYRGYPIERLSTITGRPGVSAGISYVVFVALHVSFWKIGGAIQIGLGSIVIYALYLWRRNLPACMLMHILNDAVALLLVPMFLPQ